MTVQELAHHSSAVVEGTVVQTRSFWNDEHTMIFTEAVVEVEAALVGDVPSTVTVRTVGGTVDDFRIVADGFPVFTVGERAVLFLTPTGDRFRVTGFQLGHFRLVTGADGVERALPTREQAMEPVQPKTLVPRTLDDLKATVRSAVVEPELRRRQAPFVLLSPPRSWDFPPVVVVDNRGISSIADGDFGVSRAVAAINSPAAWNGAGAGTVIFAVAGNVASFTPGDGIPMINFQDPFGVCTGSCFAATFTGFFMQRPDGTWRIFDADVVFNSGAFQWTSEGEDPGGAGCCKEIYIESRVVHETGHMLGLAHTPVAGATMFPSVSECNNQQATIEADDRNGILALY